MPTATETLTEPPDEEALDALRRTAADVLGITDLHQGQIDAMLAASQGHDVLAVMPTGYGKSAIYEVVGALDRALTVVVSPLIALQRDQVRALGEASGGPRAAALNSSLSAKATDELWRNTRAHKVGYLFLSPEQLASPDVVERLAALEIGRIAVDEAHCVSAWGHDFRPDYLAIGAVVEQLGHPVVIALTATAAPPVREEVVERLGLRQPVVVVRGFDRPNLELNVRRHTSAAEKERALTEEAVERVREGAGSGVGLVYVASRRQTEEYATVLREEGIRASPYHAGMPSKDRNSV
ncbi:MAG TPA: DEAD/DEAH box helicase [Propionibacteriaceae bacterium]|nr:DEAD/DEAH box helicase [Propionibacteriaceae bacterium]